VRLRRGNAPCRDLARGPARLTVALDVDRAFDGHDLTKRGPLFLAAGAPPAEQEIASGPRVGVAGAGATTPWRFWLTGEPTVSPYRPAVARRRPRRDNG
jgi:DNA-3-methyladenine glycosylase